MLRTVLLLAAALTQTDAAGSHGGVKEECSCAQHEADHPFTIDCANVAPIRAATVTLESRCKANNANFEWGGAFATPDNAYKWVSEAVGGAYTDPEMKLVIFDVHAADKEHLLELAETAATLISGACAVLNTQGTIPAPTPAGACYTLTFPTNASIDFHATVNTVGVANVAFFTAHLPTEFERDTHYFMSTDLTKDIEPAAETDAEEYNCKFLKDGEVKVCAKAFYIIQAHHDYCPHDTLTRYEEELFHEWESKCYGCSIVRKYDANLKKCPVIDCTDTTVAELGYEHLNETCVKADTEYAFEWAASFDTPADSYTWVSQAATMNTSLASNYTYADAEMMVVAFKMTSNLKSELFGKKEEADTLMSGTCPEVTASCTPGDTACAPAPTITPTTAGACVTVKFPDSSASLKDFHATVNTAGVAHVAFFTAHLPTEFERDTHFFMSTDLTNDIEAVKSLGESGGHDHGRRLSAVGRADRRLSAVGRNHRRFRRRLADSGSCCTTTRQQGAWKQVVAYHDECAFDQVPEYIEVGFHDYEESCEAHFCNLIEAGIDQTVCPYSPPPPPSPPPTLPPSPSPPPSPLAPAKEVSTGIAEGTLIGVIVAAVVVAAILLFGVFFLVTKEKAGKPLFSNLEPSISTTA